MVSIEDPLEAEKLLGGLSPEVTSNSLISPFDKLKRKTDTDAASGLPKEVTKSPELMMI